jgi:hypothetical protein
MTSKLHARFQYAGFLPVGTPTQAVILYELKEIATKLPQVQQLTA